jgi:hypothetical protein
LLQVATYSSDHSIKRERFVIYSVDKRDSIAEVAPPQLPEAQSWTAFSPDGCLFVVGAPLKLTAIPFALSTEWVSAGAHE